MALRIKRIGGWTGLPGRFALLVDDRFSWEA